MDGYREEDGRYAAFMSEISSFIPQQRQFTDPVRTFAYGTDASFYRLNPRLVVKVGLPSSAPPWLHSVVVLGIGTDPTPAARGPCPSECRQQGGPTYDLLMKRLNDGHLGRHACTCARQPHQMLCCAIALAHAVLSGEPASRPSTATQHLV